MGISISPIDAVVATIRILSGRSSREPHLESADFPQRYAKEVCEIRLLKIT